jgi:hypothetical protein
MQPRFGKAIVVAPLAAPVAIFSVLLVRETFVSVHEGSIAAIPVWLFALVLFGAPPAYLMGDTRIKRTVAPAMISD